MNLDSGQEAEGFTDERSGPLAGLRVIELGQLLAGPFCGQLLGDLGAEIIKLEEPNTGDPMRQWGHEKPHGLSLWWPILARNKKSVTCDLRSDEGQDLAMRLIAKSDVVIENFRPGTLERWGLGYEELKAVNEGIILARVTGYGQDGPYAPRAGYGSIGEAMGGLRYTTGDPDSPPSRTGISIGDSLAGLITTIGILAALEDRHKTGQGQVVDTAIYEAVLSVMESLVPEYQVGGYTRQRTGPVLPNVAPSNVYPTLDGEMILIAANQDTVFKRLCDAMGRPELSDDPKYATHGKRGENQVELDGLITGWTKNRSSNQLLELLAERGVAAGRVYRAKDMLDDPHFAARKALVTIASRDFGSLTMQNVVPRLSSSPGSIRWEGPPLGAHDLEVYQGLLGLTEDDVAALQESGTIRGPSDQAPVVPQPSPEI